MIARRPGMLPGMVADPSRPAHDVLCYRALWAAVLTEQIRLAAGGAPRATDCTGLSPVGRRRLRDSAQTWLASRDFEIVCAYAGVDPEYMRDGALRMIRSGRMLALQNRGRGRVVV